MEYLSMDKEKNKRRIFMNFFSHDNKSNKNLKLIPAKIEDKNSSINNLSRNKIISNELVLAKNVRPKSFCRGFNRNISTDITSYTINNANITDYKVNNNTLGSEKHDKKVEDYLNNNFSKLDEKKLYKNVSKSPINSSHNLINYDFPKSCKELKNIDWVTKENKNLTLGNLCYNS